MKNAVIIFLGLMAFACLEEPDCLRSGDSLLVINFKKLSDGKADTVAVYKIVGEGADSVFYLQQPVDALDLISKPNVRVNPFANETLFTFYFETGEKTLRIGYKTEAQFISEECGSEQVYYDLAIIETQFDSVRVVNNRLSTSGATNIEIIN